MSAAPASIPVFRSRLAYVGDVRCPGIGCDSTGEEANTDHTVAFVRSGVFVKHVGRRRFVADPNQVVFFTRDEPYRITHIDGCGDACTTFGVRTDVLLDAARPSDPAAVDRPDAPFREITARCAAELHRAHVELLARVRRGELTDLAAEEAIVTLLAAVLASVRPTGGGRERSSAATRRAHGELAEAAQQTLAARFSQRLELDDVARTAHASPFHLCRVFRRETGMSIAAYRNQLRLRTALERLADGAADLSDLALDLGYVDQSHFTTAFRRQFGLTPGDFRRTASRARLRETSRNLQV